MIAIHRRLYAQVFRRIAAIMTAAALLFALSASVCFGAGELLKNGGFEDVKDGAPANWMKDAWTTEENASLFLVETGKARSGSDSVSIENVQPNDARWVQVVEVKPKTRYKLSAWVKAEGIDDAGGGANISVLGPIETSTSVRDTHGGWQQVTLYGKTGPNQKSIAVALRLGGYGALSTGKAWFDDVTVEEVKSVPAGATAISFAAKETPAANGEKEGGSPYPVVAETFLFFLLFAVIYVGVIRQERAREWIERHIAVSAVVLVALAVALRLVLAGATYGHPTDMNTFIAWALHASKDGLGHFYNDKMFADYPPGYIYVLYVLGTIIRAFDLDGQGAALRIVIKLPAILADMMTVHYLFHLGKKYVWQATALSIAAMYAFLPAIWDDSASWGQVDSVYTLLLVLSLYALSRNNWYAGAGFYALTVLLKPQGLLFAPVILFFWLRSREWRRGGTAALLGLLTFAVLVLPFAVHKPAGWIFSLYFTTLASYPYATLNAFNLYALFGGNWKPVDDAWLWIPLHVWGTVMIVASVGFAGYLFISQYIYPRSGSRSEANEHVQNGRRSRLSLLNRLIPAKGSTDAARCIMLVSAVLIAAVFMLGSKMHERYLYPVLPLLLFAFFEWKDRRLLYLFLGFGATQTINIGYVLAFAKKDNYFIPAQDGLMILASLGNLLLLAYLVYVAIDLIRRNRVYPVAELGDGLDADDEGGDFALTNAGAQSTKQTDIARGQTAAAGQSASVPAARSGAMANGLADRRPMTRLDMLLLSILTLVYAVIAFYHLGSFKAPQTVWHPQTSGTSFYADFGEARELAQMNAFGGVGDGKFHVEFSTDAITWGSKTDVDQNYTKDFTWTKTPLTVTARYVRVTVDSPGFTLHELAFYPKGQTTPLAVKSLNGDGTTASDDTNPGRLFDEPDQTVYQPTYLYGTYFDEIYHARTAYEHLHGIKPYENTHPPFGKLLIAVGIATFGMNPFGWRVVGTVFGILMIPIMYVFGKRLFGRTEYAFASAFLMTFDFMHFAQTRISTIDVYGVFFIMLMFYWMYRYVSTNFFRDPFNKTLWPLFLSGLMFGIGAASKWIVIYGGAGLAFLFFNSLFDRYKEYVAARRRLRVPANPGSADTEAEEEARSIVKRFPKLAAKTVAWCTLFFVIIPAIVYSLTFLPALTSKGETLSFKRLIEYQTTMYDYHTKLKATHAFSSTWYEWPIMTRPIWYYDGKASVPEGDTSTIVSFGNPAVWWTGIPALFAAMWLARKKRHRGMLVVLTAFVSQYVPWILVPRLTFIYHYFAMVPFLIFCIVYVMKNIVEKRPKWKKWGYAYLALVFALFVMFYPALSGLTVPKWYVDDFLRWFPSWYF